MTEPRGPSSPRSVFLLSPLASPRRALPIDLPKTVGCSGAEHLNGEGAEAWEKTCEVVHDQANLDSSIAFFPSSLIDDDLVPASSEHHDLAFGITVRSPSEREARRQQYKKAMRALLKGSSEAALEGGEDSLSEGNSPDGASSIPGLAKYTGRVSPTRLEDMERADLLHNKLTRISRFRDGPPVIAAKHGVAPPSPLYFEYNRGHQRLSDDPPSYEQSVQHVELEA